MRRRHMFWMCAAFALGLALTASAQTRKEYSPQYLRAAISTVNTRQRMVIEGEFDISKGLMATTQSGLRGKGYSRFWVKDKQTGFAFESMYCHHESEAFRTLLNVSKRCVFEFHGHKDRGEEGEDAVFVDSVKLLSEIKPEGEAEQKEEREERPLRVTVTDNETGAKTVLVNVVKGQIYRLEGISIIVEDEPKAR